MLECTSLIYARQGTPFTVPIFAEVARIFAERDEEHPFSRHFVADFVARHHTELSMDCGKITSPTRRSDIMLQMTQDFIDQFNELVVTKKANEKKYLRF